MNLADIQNSKPGRYKIQTFGCKANLVDSQFLESSLLEKGWKPASSQESSDLFVVNSCAVTNEASKQSKKAVKRYKKKYPSKQVVFTGCAKVAEQRNTDHPEKRDNDIDHWPKFLGTKKQIYPEMSDSSRVRGFLKVQEGCDSFCTFCIIPYTRGPNRALSSDVVIKQANLLVEHGIREIVLTGINLGEYPDLAGLIKLLLNETKIERLRLSSLDPVQINRDLLDNGIFELLQTEPRLCPHFHVSLQSPNSKILKFMKRRYGYEEVSATLKRISQIPNVFVGMDLIAGFPGETLEDHKWNIETLKDLPWDRLHVFPYSERNGTAAVRLNDQVPFPERSRRAKELIHLSTARLRQTNEKILSLSKPITVLLQTLVRGPDGSKDWVSGISSNYTRVLLRKNFDWVSNSYVKVIPTDLFQNSIADVSLIGKMV